MSTILKEQRFKLIPSVYLILIKGSKVLLTRRFQTGYCDGFYSLPAGHLDGNETARGGLIREVKEEIGLEINQESLTFRHFMHRLAEDERVDFFFTASNFLGEPKIMEPEKCDDLSWFDWDNLPSNTIPYIKQAIERTVKGIFYSEHGWEHSMTFGEYQNKAKQTAIHPEKYKLIYPVMGLAGEAGEVANKAGKIYRDDGGVVSQQKKDELTKELGDVLWFVSQIATDLDLSLDEIARFNLEKLASRQSRGMLNGSGDNR